MESNIDDVMRRVKKLLAVAEDGRGDPNEAATAAAMAERIMRKYQIEHADVIEVELKRGGESFGSVDVGTTLDPEGFSKESSGWAGILAVAVAKLHDCQARYCWTQEHGKSLRFSGYKADADMARFTYVYLVRTMAAAGKQYAKAAPRSRGECESFRRGFNAAMTSSLYAAARAKSKEMEEQASSRALVVIKRDAVAEHFGVIKYRKGGSFRTSSADAFTHGLEEGRKVDVTRRGVGVNGGHPALAH